MGKKVKLDVSGMHCASCSKILTGELKGIGAKKISVNPVTGKAFAEVEDNTTEKHLKKAVKSAGFKPMGVFFEDSASSSSNSNNSEVEIGFWRRKLFFVWGLTLLIMFFMYSEFLFGQHLVNMNTMTILMLAFSFPIIFIFGFDTVKSGILGLFKLRFTMDSLIALGTVVAYLTGIFSFFTDIVSFAGVSGMIMTIFITGKFIEAKAKGRATSEIQKLLELGAKKATILKSGKEIEVDISEVKIGDVMIVKPGEKIPTDGIVVKGESAVDESMITGESVPVEKKKKSVVIGSTINQDGILHIKATKVGKDTFLSHIIKLVEEAQGTKVPIQKFADKVTGIFVPIILGLSVLTFVGWYVLGSSLGIALNNAISVLVIACPCSLGLAVPISLMVGSGMGAKNGILIRNGEAIQTMKEVRTIVFDKTGTITKGEMSVSSSHSQDEKKMFEYAGSLEKLSEHPISKAIVRKASLKKYLDVEKFKVIRGRGIEGFVDGDLVVVGTERLMKEKGIGISKYQKYFSEFEKRGETTLGVSVSGEIIGVIGVSDVLKDDSVSAIKKLNAQGYRTVMITGDNERTAKSIAEKVGIKEVIAGVLPEDKSNEIKKLKRKGMVAFVGDGINDAPALKEANVGIAIGTGTDIAIEAGDIVLAKGSLTGVVQSINLSKVTFGKIKQNLFWAFFYNVVAIPLAVGGALNPVIAELAMALSSITVVTNANLLRMSKI